MKDEKAIAKRKELNNKLWADIDQEQLEREIFGNIFEDYLTSCRKGHSNPTVPIKIFYALKKFSESKLETGRLITINQIQKMTGINDVMLRRHIVSFVIVGFLQDHRHLTHLLGNKKEVTYTVKPFSEWNNDWLVDINNHIMILRKEQ